MVMSEKWIITTRSRLWMGAHCSSHAEHWNRQQKRRRWKTCETTTRLLSFALRLRRRALISSIWQLSRTSINHVRSLIRTQWYSATNTATADSASAAAYKIQMFRVTLQFRNSSLCERWTDGRSVGRSAAVAAASVQLWIAVCIFSNEECWNFCARINGSSEHHSFQFLPVAHRSSTYLFILFVTAPDRFIIASLQLLRYMFRMPFLNH